MNNSYAYFAGGCFWGVEYFFTKEEAVKEAVSGYMGGDKVDPTYQDVCHKNTGHFEVVRVEYDSSKIDYESLAKLFFEIHDPTQKNGQGPDIGEQYLSAIFVQNDEERTIIKSLIKQLEEKGLKIATKILENAIFYKAEDHHQRYYSKTGNTPSCHAYTKRF